MGSRGIKLPKTLNTIYEDSMDSLLLHVPKRMGKKACPDLGSPKGRIEFTAT